MEGMGVDEVARSVQIQESMKRVLSHFFLTVLLCLPFTACSTSQKTSLHGVREGGDTFTGTVIESTPERITIKLKDTPKLLVLEGTASVAQR